MQDPPKFNQATDRGINNISISETINGQTAPIQPQPPRLDLWERWPMRWIGCFCLGVAIPSCYALLPALPSLIFSTLLILGLLMLAGWAMWHRHHWVPAAIAILTLTLGLIFSLLSLANLTHESRKQLPAVPADYRSL